MLGRGWARTTAATAGRGGPGPLPSWMAGDGLGPWQLLLAGWGALRAPSAVDRWWPRTVAVAGGWGRGHGAALLIVCVGSA